MRWRFPYQRSATMPSSAAPEIWQQDRSLTRSRKAIDPQVVRSCRRWCEVVIHRDVGARDDDSAAGDGLPPRAATAADLLPSTTLKDFFPFLFFVESASTPVGSCLLAISFGLRTNVLMYDCFYRGNATARLVIHAGTVVVDRGSPPRRPLQRHERPFPQETGNDDPAYRLKPAECLQTRLVGA